VDEAAWDALRKLEPELDPTTIARAILRAQHLAIRYGITSIGDNTFYPSVGAQYARMARAGALKVRVSMRSYGPEPMTRLTMKSLGTAAFGKPGTQIRYFGDKYFVDASLSTAGAVATGAQRLENETRYTVEELRNSMLFAGQFGTAFHVQSREGAERLVAARMGIRDRREGSLPDIIDHCGLCGGGSLPRQIHDAGFQVTILPGQLHDLPSLLRDLAPNTHAMLLQFRELVAAGVHPALTSDWPYGAEKAYPELPDGFHRTGLAPLANVAVAVSGKDPNGAAIEGAATRTISVGAALLGVTAYGARAIGRDDVGTIAPAARADFVVLPQSPFDVEPVALYRTEPLATYIGGESAGRSLPGDEQNDLPSEARAVDLGSKPWGHALSPILGYDPVPGLLVGGAFFFYPYEPRGLLGSVQAYVSPAQRRAYTELDVTALRWFGPVSPRLGIRVNTLRERYYGIGMRTDPNIYVKTEPLRVDGSVGILISAGPTTSVGVDVRTGIVKDAEATDIQALVGNAEGTVNGAYAGVRLECSHDTRDNSFSTRFGGREVLWTESYGLQSDLASFRQRIGLTWNRFVPLWAPDFILAMRVDAGASLGTKNYATDYALGGGDVLRGYYSNRFRGDDFAVGGAELRWPLYGPLSAAAFGELGRVWLNEEPNSGHLATSGGGGFRFGLPPDRLIRLRFDAGFAPDQWGIFFKFNEAY
jgi:hypothetical protein